MPEINLQQLSKTISLALRHEPHKFALFLDKEGWVKLDDLIRALRPLKAGWEKIDAATIEKLIRESEKKRFEILDGRIRAYYGHSVAQTIEKESTRPPDTLYHGTTAWAWKKISKEGLRPMKRQYVHLSVDTDTAQNVGERRTDDVLLLVIDAASAWNNGIQFYHGNEGTWLAERIPPHYITYEEEN
ncbi:MAG: RNA 2'-phosphotransferase [Bacteroidia bacterium]